MVNPFRLSHEDISSGARCGLLKTRHGTVKTPFFMPVATKAVGKYVGAEEYNATKTQAIISNALVLSLQPGTSVMESFGGIHPFMNFSGTVFTDCGGFQASRESFQKKVGKQGIQFTNPFSKQDFWLTPKKIMEIQMAIKSDVAMVLDDMQPYGASHKQCALALENTHRWAQECITHHTDKKQLLFGIVQGGFFPELRKASARVVNELEVDGVALGGLALGEPKKLMYQAIDAAMPELDTAKVTYAMGVGSPEDLLLCIERGIDCFDSVFPTMNARNNTLFTWKGKMDIIKARFKEDRRPVDEGCDCPVCQRYSRAYLRHLSKLEDPVGKKLKSIHNIRFMHQLMERAREAIKEHRFVSFRKQFEKDFAHKL